MQEVSEITALPPVLGECAKLPGELPRRMACGNRPCPQSSSRLPPAPIYHKRPSLTVPNRPCPRLAHIMTETKGAIACGRPGRHPPGSTDLPKFTKAMLEGSPALAGQSLPLAYLLPPRRIPLDQATNEVAFLFFHRRFVTAASAPIPKKTVPNRP